MAKENLDIIVDDKGTMRKYSRKAGFAEKATGKLEKNVKRLAVAFVSIEGARKAFDLAETAARANDVEKAFENLASSAGIQADKMLESMKEATAGTIAEFELMQQFSSASLLGLPLDRFDEMLAIARGASKATGQTMEFMLNSIVTALGRGSKLMLDNLGILIDVRSANERYAESLGKVSKNLTDAERKQAFINDALRIGNENLERIGELADSDADKFAKLTADTENLKIALGNALIPVLNEVVPVLTDMANAVRDILEASEDADDPIKALNDRIAASTLKMIEGRISVDLWKGSVTALRAEIQLLKDQAVADALAPIILESRLEWIAMGEAAVEAMQKASTAGGISQESWEAMVQAQIDARNEAEKTAIGMDGVASSVRNIANALQSVIDLSDLKKMTGLQALLAIANVGVGISSGISAFGAIKGFLGFAGGGTSPGGPILVGERGPEIINPPAGTQIVNNNTTQQMLGDRTINLVVDGQVLATVIERGSELGQNNIALT